jgi:hypothetical protein
VEDLLKTAPVGGKVLVWFWSSFHRSRFASSWALNDDALDESIGHHKHSSGEVPRSILQAMEASSKFGDDIG